ncbi:MAG: class I SAM-dependent methyltransferase [Magnetococcales bacterium]|nr:class I SAM-dependent methyltransferase [Magnetococcales bacterium]
MNLNHKRDYVEVVYNEQERPLTDYPEQLTKYLVQRYDIADGQNILDIGCGRGEFLRGFMLCGLQGFGVDRSTAAQQLCPDAQLAVADIENAKLPYEDNFFDVVFSKSVIEHFYYPDNFMQEIFRVLKPGGLVITMCPDWEANMRIYFEDYTHRTPFTITSLRDIQLINGFENVECEFFRQLPILWRYPLMLILAEITRYITPAKLKPHSKFIRFAKEIMLLSSAYKPLIGSWEKSSEK